MAARPPNFEKIGNVMFQLCTLSTYNSSTKSTLHNYSHTLYNSYSMLKNSISIGMQRRVKDLGIAKLTEAARLCGFKTQEEYRNFVNYYHGKRTPDNATLVRIAKGLQTTAGELLGEKGSDFKSPVERDRMLLCFRLITAVVLKKRLGPLFDGNKLTQLVEDFYDESTRKGVEPNEEMAEEAINWAMKGMALYDGPAGGKRQ